MEIRNVTSIFFSPTGSTRRLVSMLSKTFPSKPREVDITPYTQRGLSMDFGPDDLVLFGVPVYGGRIPSPAVQTLRRMQAAGRLPSWLRPTATANMTTRCWSLRILPLQTGLSHSQRPR